MKSLGRTIPLLLLLGAFAFAGSSQPATYVAQDGTNYIFYRDINSHIQEVYLPQNGWTGANWRHGDLTEATGAVTAGGSPTGYVAPDGTDYVMYRDVDNHIQVLYLPKNGRGGTTWLNADLSAITGAPNTAGDPAAFVATDGTNYLLYRDVNNHIQALYFPQNGENGGSWQKADLSATANAPAAAGDPAAFLAKNGTRYVFYCDFSGHIQALHLAVNGTKWVHEDLTAATGAPAASGEPNGFVATDGTDYVMYRDVNWHVQALSLPQNGFNNTKWLHGDLTSATGAALAAGDPENFAAPDETDYVIFRDTSSHVVALYLPHNGSGGARWLRGDLTSVGAPLIGGKPSSYVSPDDTDRVVYRDTGGNLEALSFSHNGECGGGWKAANLSSLTGAPLVF